MVHLVGWKAADFRLYGSTAGDAHLHAVARPKVERFITPFSGILSGWKGRIVAVAEGIKCARNTQTNEATIDRFEPSTR